MKLIDANELMRKVSSSPLIDFTDDDIFDIIKDLPAVVKRQQGEWIYPDKEDKEKGFGGYCSICYSDMPIGMNDWKAEYYESKYCPNCGAYMKGGEAVAEDIGNN